MTKPSAAFVCHACAKINLSLRILGVRNDGFHELQTTFQTIDLCDDLTFETYDGPLSLECDTSDVPRDDRNLVWRAADAVWRASGRTGDPGGVRVRLAKRIPAQAGLGGGSADAAIALQAFARIWETRLRLDELTSLGSRLGADVPFFFSGGRACATGRGDAIEPLPDGALQWVVVALPPFGISTADAFRWWDEDAASAAGNGSAYGVEGIWNDFEGPVGRRLPAVLILKRALIESGATAAGLSGSGSAVFGLFDTEHAARASGERLNDARHVFVCRTLGRAEYAARVGLA